MLTPAIADVKVPLTELGAAFSRHPRYLAESPGTRYWHDENFEALKVVGEATEKAGLTMGEAALRWMSHHSMMSPCVHFALSAGFAHLMSCSEHGDSGEIVNRDTQTHSS